MKNVILSLFFAFLSGAVVAQDSKAPAPLVTPDADSKNMPEFKFEVEEYNFGTAKQGETITYDFSFTNTGKEPLIISNAQASCGCTVPEWPKEPIKKGDKASIKVSFNTSGKMGLQDKTVTITSNAKSATKVLHVKGNVEAPPAKTEAVPIEEKSK